VQVRQRLNLRHKEDRDTEEKEISSCLYVSKGEDRSIFPFCVKAHAFPERHGKKDKNRSFRARRS